MHLQFCIIFEKKVLCYKRPMLCCMQFKKASLCLDLRLRLMEEVSHLTTSSWFLEISKCDEKIIPDVSLLFDHKVSFQTHFLSHLQNHPADYLRFKIYFFRHDINVCIFYKLLCECFEVGKSIWCSIHSF